MYKSILILLILQSCISIGKLPNDLPKSILMVELLPTNFEEYYDSKTTISEKKSYEKMAMKNKSINKETINIFSNYPFQVIFVQNEEISKSYDSSTTNYLLGYGMSNYNNTIEIKNLFLQNLLTGTIIKHFKVTGNMNTIAPKFIAKAKKVTLK